MYRFHIVQEEEGSWRFELNGINLFIDGFFIKDEKHWITNPTKAIAFFYINSNLYGVLNDIRTVATAEELYDCMYEQYLIFKGNKNSVHNTSISQSTQQNNNNIQGKLSA